MFAGSPNAAAGGAECDSAVKAAAWEAKKALCDAIVAQALRQGDAGDSDFAPTFTNLRGLNSLANSDPAWERLTVPDSTGFCGVCSSSLVAADFGTGASAFTSCGHAVYHRNAAGNVSFEPQDSPAPVLGTVQPERGEDSLRSVFGGASPRKPRRRRPNTL